MRAAGTACWLQVAPAEHLAEVVQQKSDAREVASGLESLVKSQDGEIVTEYLRRTRTGGEAAAYKWLRKQKR